MILLAVLSLGSTALISGLLSLGFYFIDPNLAKAVFWISFALILIIMHPVNWILKTRHLKEEGKRLKEASEFGKVANKQFISLECEYCSEVNPVKVALNEENSFTCKKCKNENKILISFATTRTSSPFTMEVAPEENVVDEMKHMEEVPNDER